MEISLKNAQGQIVRSSVGLDGKIRLRIVDESGSFMTMEFTTDEWRAFVRTAVVIEQTVEASNFEDDATEIDE